MFCSTETLKKRYCKATLDVFVLYQQILIYKLDYGIKLN